VRRRFWRRCCRRSYALKLRSIEYLGAICLIFVTEQHVFKFRHVQHIVDTEYEAKIPGYRTPVPGLFLSNFSQIYPEDRGTNFAVREGKRVAALVMEELGVAPD
jgi:hypothetical protein